MIYFAYGSNLNLPQMALRCPNAEPLCTTTLPGWRLVFRGVLDVEPAKGHVVHGGLFRITPKCEAALDQYEGYPRFYTKRDFRVKLNGKTEDGIFYTIRLQKHYPISIPVPYYYNVCREGYEHWGIDLKHLEAALHHAEEIHGRKYGSIIDYADADPADVDPDDFREVEDEFGLEYEGGEDG